MNQKIELTAEIPIEAAGKRLDQVLAQIFSEHSRSRIQDWIEKGFVKIDGEQKRGRDKVKGGEQVEISAAQETLTSWTGEDLPLDIIFEDEELLVINKPTDFVVHPAAGHAGGTLVNALLHYLPQLSELPRAGIVHRLDKDTTGLLVVAKTMNAHNKLGSSLQMREVERVYEAIVQGVMPAGGTLTAWLDRHPHDRKKRTVVEAGRGKEATTHYRVLQKFRAHSHLQLKLETGRTHQIRVHMAHISYPILGDKTYGGRLRLPPNADPSFLQMIREFPRQALHARRLSLMHPKTGESMSWESPLPADMQALLLALKADLDRSQK
jgi:23S rRNA pseudouridine1911/1915/1917 synthase